MIGTEQILNGTPLRIEAQCDHRGIPDFLDILAVRCANRLSQVRLISVPVLETWRRADDADRSDETPVEFKSERDSCLKFVDGELVEYARSTTDGKTLVTVNQLEHGDEITGTKAWVKISSMLESDHDDKEGISITIADGRLCSCERMNGRTTFSADFDDSEEKRALLRITVNKFGNSGLETTYCEYSDSRFVQGRVVRHVAIGSNEYAGGARAWIEAQGKATRALDGEPDAVRQFRQDFLLA
jgi:hypothetical protein